MKTLPSFKLVLMVCASLVSFGCTRAKIATIAPATSQVIASEGQLRSTPRFQVVAYQARSAEEHRQLCLTSAYKLTGVAQPHSTCADSATVWQSATQLSEVAAAEFRTVFIREHRVVTTGAADRIVRVAVTEFVDDINAQKSSFTPPTMQVGNLLTVVVPQMAITTASVVAPIAGVLPNIDLLTGIPLKTNSGERVGGIVVDVAVLRPNNTVLSSFPLRATFVRRFNQRGDSVSSYSQSVAGTSAQDALRVLANEGVRKILGGPEAEKTE